MTPQESELVNALFDRLAKIEGAPRDAAAERLIEDGARRAPHALYALVQTVLLQDEGLKRANARIEELQAQAAEGAAQEQGQGQGQGSFLDSLREAFAPHEPRGSVPSVRAAGTAPGGTAPEMAPPREYSPQMPPTPGYGAPPSGAGGGSFLGPAASTAAGMIGGALLLDGIRSMFGHRAGATDANAIGGLARGNTSGSAVDSDLTRTAGIDDIGDAARGDRDKAAAADLDHGAGSDPSANADADAPFDESNDIDNADDTSLSDDDFDSDDDSDNDSYDV
jgi:uncharacterized protein